MKTKANQNIRELRRILGQTQGEFAATIGAAKDTVASWETGRNPVSAALARRIALATGVDERTLLKPRASLMTLDWPRRPFTREEHERHRKTFWGGGTEANLRQHLQRCSAALELLLAAAARHEGGSRLTGVLGSFIQWCQEAREDFELRAGIDAELSQRRRVEEFNKSYDQWREMAKTDPDMARQFGFKDDPKKGGQEMLKLSLDTVPMWMPGVSGMRSRRVKN